MLTLKGRSLRIGEVEASTTQGLYVVRLELVPKTGQRLYDSRGKEIGMVKDLIGNVRKPYAVVSVNDRTRPLKQGQSLFSEAKRR